MNVRVLFNDGTETTYEASGWGGDPLVPFTVEFITGYGDDRRRVSIPLFAIKEVEWEDWGA